MHRGAAGLEPRVERDEELGDGHALPRLARVLLEPDARRVGTTLPPALERMPALRLWVALMMPSRTAKRRSTGLRWLGPRGCNTANNSKARNAVFCCAPTVAFQWSTSAHSLTSPSSRARGRAVQRTRDRWGGAPSLRPKAPWPPCPEGS